MSLHESSGQAGRMTPEEKRALLARLLREKAAAQPPARHPLSYGQKSLWYLHQLDPASPAYNEAFTCRVRSPLELGPLVETVAQGLVDRHPALRTTYGSQLGEPWQQIHARQSVAVPVTDASSWRPAELERRLKEEASRSFDLEQGPMLRLSVFRCSAQEYMLLITFHHIAIDLWSLMLLMGELRSMLATRLLGMESPLQSPSAQYIDYVRWQSQMLEGPAGQAHWDYWCKQLAGELPLLDLPMDRPRPPVPSFRGAHKVFRLDREVSQKLKKLAQEEQTTLFTLLLAAFQVFLGRCTGQTDVLVGSLVAGRTRPEFERVVGFFANAVPLRADLSADPPFKVFLSQVRQTVLDAMAHQDFPYSLLVERLLPRRDPSRPPLCNITFILQQPRQLDSEAPAAGAGEMQLLAPAQRLARQSFGNTMGDMAPLDLGIVKSDLDLEMYETAGVLGGFLCYSTDLFEEATIERLLSNFEVLLKGIVVQPDCPLSRLPLLTRVESRQVLQEWAGPFPAVGSEKCLHQLFEEQAERSPDAPAILAGGEQWSYCELNQRANRLTHQLQAQGVGPDVCVAVCAERSPQLVAALLAVLKAGGAYVPLDPDYPPERLRYLLEDAAAPVLLTQANLLDRLPQHQAAVVLLDDLDQPCNGCTACQAGSPCLTANETLAAEVRPDHLAYVIYTSGSTGQPKGVMVPHRGVVNRILWGQLAHPLFATDRVLQSASFCFDASVLELFAPLAAGACLVLAEPGPSDPAALVALMQEQQVTVATFVPPLLEAVLDQPGSRGCTSLRYVICGGEALGVPLQERFFATWKAQLFNFYGPTETSIDAAWWECRPGDSRLSVPIGRPIGGMRAHVLDGQMQPVPVGVVGELYLAGVGLARGYLNQPGKTAERFLADPFSSKPGARLYRTGDLVRWSPEGLLEFRGRVDHQVKVRGYRIELGEVEARLAEHPGVAEAIAVVREDVPGDKRLISYVVPKACASRTDCQSVLQGEEQLSVSDLRGFLQQRLPGYMIPSAFVLLDAFPRTAGGKVDRRALPAPQQGRGEAEQEWMAPRTPLEEALAGIWAQVLGLERVGIHDNFFDRGGHSLQAAQLVARIQAALSRKVSIRDVFLAPTVAELAELMEKQPVAHQPEALARDATSPSLTLRASVPAHVTVVREPLETLLATGKEPPVEAAALGYILSDVAQQVGIDPDFLVKDGLNNRPVVARIQETSLGRVASVLIPRFDYQLYQDRDDLLANLREALRLCRRIGARTVSLTGLLPSATAYGEALADLGEDDLPTITTGHATTTATVVLTVQNSLRQAGRDLSREHVGFVGLGSVGLATLRLLLRCGPHPAALSLCDVYSKRAALDALRREIVEELGFQGPVHLLESRGQTPAALYQATLIVGATNVGNILDLSQVQPGTILVDDSAPHCFPPDQAIRRFRERGDILFTEGGVLEAPSIIPQVVHVPALLERLLPVNPVELLAGTQPRNITGCVLSSLLSSRFASLPPTVGLVDSSSSLRHYAMLEQLGYQAAPLHCEDFVLEEAQVQRFRQRLGQQNGRSSALPVRGREAVPASRTVADYQLEEKSVGG